MKKQIHNLNKIHCITLRTELIVGSVSVPIDPHLPHAVVFNTRILLVVQPVQCSTNYCVYLQRQPKHIKRVIQHLMKI